MSAIHWASNISRCSCTAPSTQNGRNHILRVAPILMVCLVISLKPSLTFRWSGSTRSETVYETYAQTRTLFNVDQVLFAEKPIVSTSPRDRQWLIVCLDRSIQARIIGPSRLYCQRTCLPRWNTIVRTLPTTQQWPCTGPDWLRTSKSKRNLMWLSTTCQCTARLRLRTRRKSSTSDQKIKSWRLLYVLTRDLLCDD